MIHHSDAVYRVDVSDLAAGILQLFHSYSFAVEVLYVLMCNYKKTVKLLNEFNKLFPFGGGY